MPDDHAPAPPRPVEYDATPGFAALVSVLSFLVSGEAKKFSLVVASEDGPATAAVVARVEGGRDAALCALSPDQAEAAAALAEAMRGPATPGGEEPADGEKEELGNLAHTLRAAAGACREVRARAMN